VFFGALGVAGGSLTRPGGPAAGLPDDFACLRGDIPGDQVDDDPGRALPEEVLRQL
jgi:hypothetical protein